MFAKGFVTALIDKAVAADAASSVTQALENWPQLCLYTDADADTGTVWVLLDFCNYDATFYFTGVLPDGSVRSIQNGTCLDAGDMSEGTHVEFTTCNSGSLQQKWTFIPDSSFTTESAVTDGKQSGQIALLQGDSSNGASAVCLEAPSEDGDPLPGRRMALAPCNPSWIFQKLFQQPLPPEGATTIVADALRDVGDACVVYEGREVTTLTFGDCEANNAMKFWVVEHTAEGSLIRSSIQSDWCMAVPGNDGDLVISTPCDGEALHGAHYFKLWTLNEATGSLQLARKGGCLTLRLWQGGQHLFVTDCTGSWDQKFAFGSGKPQVDRSDSPALWIYNAEHCIDAPGWFDFHGSSCFAYAIPGHVSAGCDSYAPRRGNTPKSACCCCQTPQYLSVSQGLSLAMISAPFSGWAMQSGSIMYRQQCLDLAEGQLQLRACEASSTQGWAFNRTAGTIASLGKLGYCVQRRGEVVNVAACTEGMGWHMAVDLRDSLAAPSAPSIEVAV